MNKLLNFISSNALASSLTAAAILGGLAWVAKAKEDRRDSQKIYKFLLDSKENTGFTFRTTEAISSHTGLSESRVALLCADHPNIRRNEKQLQSWTLAE
ncbi:hypothetical protein [[Pseudomonas] boreopolis]|uniref:Uncharacterized protein n=1 Tax=Xanthomonas boreopolis TaxID=86183 RepID=A0A919KK72_9XANT|nr:hypothetical protein GCM10009090_38200 [[Pseudomonas] boreopolis]